MSQLRFSFPFKPKPPRASARRSKDTEEALRIANDAMKWICEAFEETAEQLRLTLRSCSETPGESGDKAESTFQGLFGEVHLSLMKLESAVESVFFKNRRRLTDAEMKMNLAKAFSQATNTIWAQISFSMRSSPNLKVEQAVKVVEAACEKCAAQRSEYEQQIKQCEERLSTASELSPPHESDSVETQRFDWEAPAWRQTQRILDYLSSFLAKDLNTTQLSSGLHAILQEVCAPRREAEVVKELEKEVRKVRWRADVLARSLREAHRLKGEATVELERLHVLDESHLSDLETCRRENLALREELKALTERSRQGLEDLRRKLVSSEEGMRSLHDQVMKMGEVTAGFEAKVYAQIRRYEDRLETLRSKLASARRHKPKSASEDWGSDLRTNTYRLEAQSREIKEMSAQLQALRLAVAAMQPRCTLSIVPLSAINIAADSSSVQVVERLHKELMAKTQQLTEATQHHATEVADAESARAERAAAVAELTDAQDQVASLRAVVEQLQQRETELVQACEVATLQRATSDELASSVQVQLDRAQELLARWSAAFSAPSESPEDAAASVGRMRKEYQELRSSHSTQEAAGLPIGSADLRVQLQELEEEHVFLSQENIELLRQLDDYRTEKVKNAVLLADLQATLRELEKNWTDAKRHEKEMESEVQTLTEALDRATVQDSKTVDSEQVRRILDEMEEKDKQLLHLRTLAGTYREQVAALKAQVQEKEDENQSLEEQQLLVLQELEVLQQPLEQVVTDAAHKTAELSLLQTKYADQAQRVQHLIAENSALQDKNKLLMDTLSELKSGERMLAELGISKEKSLDFGEDGINSSSDTLSKSAAQDLHTLLGLDEACEVCRKVNFASREWVLVRLPKGEFCWVAVGSAAPTAPEQLACKYREVERLVRAYEPIADITLAVSHALCLLERAQLMRKGNVVYLSSESTTSSVQLDAEHLRDLVLKLLPLLPAV